VSVLDQVDAHYTPDWVADRVAAELAVLARTTRPHIADYTAGDGALLRAASRVLPQARITATDIAPAAVQSLKAANPTWKVGTCDLLSTRSRSSSPLLGRRGRPADLVVLNPPFSYRGGTYFCVLNKAFRASPAMAFVAIALEQLADGGSAVVLVPSGTLHSQKDEMLWQRLREACTVRVVDQFARTTFRGEHATVSMLALSGVSREVLQSPAQGSSVEAADDEFGGTADLRLIRGSQPMHAVQPSRRGLALVHSTHLVDRATLRGPRVAVRAPTVVGPAVLLPRVGKPNRDKIALYLAHDEIVLSDCVIALRGRTRAITKRALAELTENWDDLAALYQGTCASYITVRNLRQHLEKLGFSVELRGRGG
jgi:predicted RNA methylase